MQIRCPGCMAEINDSNIHCPYCGRKLSIQNRPHQLPVGTVLKDRYLIGRVLGEGGFGITYIGYDNTLKMKIAVKEYYPSGMATRLSASSLDVDLTQTNAETASLALKGKQRFEDEAHTLAMFASEPNIVCIRDLFEDNSTAYIIMEYLEGKDFRQVVQESGTLPFNDVYKLLSPVMKVLDKIHKQGLIHRDISPANLLLMPDGKVKLLDFGTARDYNGENKSLSVVLTPDYAPPEQYQSHGKQGPHTDVYALSATIYMLITGRTPGNAVDRIVDDHLLPPSVYGAKISPAQEAVLMRGLAVRVEDRIKSMSELQTEFETASRISSAQQFNSFQQSGGFNMASTQRLSDLPEFHETEGEYTRNLKANPPVRPAENSGYAGDNGSNVSSGGYAETPVPQKKRGKNKKKRGKSDELIFADGTENPKKHKALKIALIAAAAAVAVIAAVFVLPMFGSDGSGNNSVSVGNGITLDSYSYKNYYSIEDQTITGSMLKQLDTGKALSLNLFRCVFDESIVKEIAEIENLDSLTIYNCTGFTDLSSLGSSKWLTNIDISYYASGLDDTNIYDIDKLFTSGLKNITNLTLSGCRASEGGTSLKHFPAVEYLSVSLFEIDAINLENISGMTSLDRLYLNNVITDGNFNALSSCTALTNIDMCGLGVDSLSWVSSMTELETLTMTENAITDLDGLSGHEKLTTVDLSDNSISDISGLADSTGMMWLYLSNNAVTDVSILSGMTKLNTLMLDGNKITDISPISACTGLKSLNLNGNAIEDASSLSSLTSMEYLRVNSTGIDNLDFCREMIYLITLEAANCEITDISGLENTTQLETLDLTNNQITDISDISKNSEHLSCLYLANNQVTDLSPIENFMLLDALTIDNNGISDISPLSGCLVLSVLSASNNSISDISALEGGVTLKYIDLGSNSISDISPLATCTNSEQVLFLEHNNISDISTLPTEVDYYLLSLYGNNITDYSVIETMTELNSLYTYIYLSWDENADLTPAARSGCDNLIITDVPLDRQVQLKENLQAAKEEYQEYGLFYSPEYKSTEEADADMAQIRAGAQDERNTLSLGFGISRWLS